MHRLRSASVSALIRMRWSRKRQRCRHDDDHRSGRCPVPDRDANPRRSDGFGPDPRHDHARPDHYGPGLRLHPQAYRRQQDVLYVVAAAVPEQSEQALHSQQRSQLNSSQWRHLASPQWAVP